MLFRSRNIPAVKALAELGPPNVIKMAERFGLPPNMPPYLSLALGSVEETLWDMTSAYTVFPNQGVRMTPYAVSSIADREGNVLEENRPEPHEAIRADTAFVMTNLMRGVVERGEDGEGRVAPQVADDVPAVGRRRVADLATQERADLDDVLPPALQRGAEEGRDHRRGGPGRAHPHRVAHRPGVPLQRRRQRGEVVGEEEVLVVDAHQRHAEPRAGRGRAGSKSTIPRSAEKASSSSSNRSTSGPRTRAWKSTPADTDRITSRRPPE